MGEEAQRLMRVAIDAYAERDDGKAAALDDMDDRLDTLHKDYIQAIFETHKAAGLDLQAGVQLALIGRYYERIGDHAVNIGERVRYMVTGWMPEHTGAARVAARFEAKEARFGDAQTAMPDRPMAGGRRCPTSEVVQRSRLDRQRRPRADAAARHERRRHRGAGHPRPRRRARRRRVTRSSSPRRCTT